MNQEPCAVCGGKDLNLIDGYYYCVECGTQDTTARETVIDHNELADGTLGLVVAQKIHTTIKDGVEMSPEWTKWHTFNFILSGLADEMISLGASPSFKTKLLWVWTRYMRTFHHKEDVLSKSHLQEFYKDESENRKKKKRKGHMNNPTTRFDKFEGTIITFHLLISLIYVALNLDRSDILLSHLQRFLVDGHLSSTHCTKYVPKDLDTRNIPKWSDFNRQCSIFHQDFDSVKSTLRFRMTAMSAFKKLDLGPPLVPDLRKIVNNCLAELCLPIEFENLVHSLLELAPLDHLSLNEISMKDTLRMPDYEGMVMAYIIVALKMCFSLDDYYEIELSNEIDKINSEANHPKSYKIGAYSDLTDRLFSFKEWCNFLQFRKIILSKHYLPIAESNGIEADDYLFMEHGKERPVFRKKLYSVLTMEIMDQIPLDNEHPVIPKSEFIPTLTPMTSYTQVVLEYLQDPDLKLLLSEDFTRYSLKYACSDLKLPTKDNNIFEGVTKENFTVDTILKNETRGSVLDDTAMVFVKNCENKNWLTTKPPKKEHLIKIEYDSDKDSLGYDYDSNDEITDDSRIQKRISFVETLENDSAIDIFESLSIFSEHFDDIKTEPELMREEDKDKSIFDDDFADCKKEIVDSDNDDQIENNLLQHDQIENNFAQHDSMENHFESDSENQIIDSKLEQSFDPSTFDREETVKELVLAACKEYKIPIPVEYKPVTRKRKAELTNDIEAKRRRPAHETDDQNKTNYGDAKKIVDKILTAYYAHLDKQSRINVSANIQDVIRPEFDETLNSIDTNSHAPINDDNGFVNNEENIDEVVQNAIDAATDSSCILEGTLHNSDDELDSFLVGGDPKYDDKNYDVRQLYLKFKNELNIDDILKPDEEIEKIISKQLDGVTETRNDGILEISVADTTEKPVIDEEDSNLSDSSEDEITLKELKQRLDPIKLNEPCTDYLINQQTDVKCFNYWMRTYPPQYAFKSMAINARFDEDLEHKFSKSFNFILNECALIINSTPYQLYKNFQAVELRLAAVRAPIYVEKLDPSDCSD